MTILVRLLLTCILAAAVSAPTEARYACAVMKTPDGFVSLRQGPSARHSEVAKMKPEELLGLLHPPGYDNIVRQGDWLFVRWSPGTRRTADNIPDVDEAKVRTGWVRDKLLNCFEE